jgi:hypothetical protein
MLTKLRSLYGCKILHTVVSRRTRVRYRSGLDLRGGIQTQMPGLALFMFAVLLPSISLYAVRLLLSFSRHLLLSAGFDFSQKPLQFQTISGPLGGGYFLNEKRPPSIRMTIRASSIPIRPPRG